MKKLEELSPSGSIKWDDQPPSEIEFPRDCDFDMDDAFSKETFKKSTSRFSCSCQVAEYGFLNPSFINGHLVVFSEDIFLVIFMDIDSISFFHRIKVNIDAVNLHNVGIEPSIIKTPRVE